MGRGAGGGGETKTKSESGGGVWIGLGLDWTGCLARYGVGDNAAVGTWSG